MIEIKQATISELEQWWDNEIESESDEKQKMREIKWKDIFITENKNGKRKTFYAWDKNKIIGQATLVFANSEAEINKLEIEPQYRGKGMATKIMKHLEKYARQNNIHNLTIGVEPKEVKNMQIYFHWGYTDFVRIVPGDAEHYPYLVYSKHLNKEQK